MNTRALTAALITLALAACTSTPTISPTPAATATPPPTATPVITPAPTLLPTPTPTASVPPTPTPTGSHTVTPPPTLAPTPTESPTATPSPSPTTSPTAPPPAWPEADRIARGAFSEPAIAIDASGAVHIAVTGTGTDNQGIWYLTNATGRWVMQQVVTPWIGTDEENPGRVDEPTLAIDPSDGSVWIAFIFWACTDCYPNSSDGIFYVTNASGSWSAPAVIAAASESTFWSAMWPSLAVRDGKIYLAWATGGDYVSYGQPLVGSNASGEWTDEALARVGVLPHLVLDPSGTVGVLFAARDIRYARQKANGDFVVERLPQAAGMSAPWAYSVLAIDDVSGDSWAAWNVPTDDQGNHDVYVANRGPDGWSDPVMAIADGELIGLGVHDGVVQLTADKSGTTYASNAGGAFVEQVIDASAAYWESSSFTLGLNGRPYVVYTRDESGPMGIWFLKGPAV